MPKKRSKAPAVRSSDAPSKQNKIDEMMYTKLGLEREQALMNNFGSGVGQFNPFGFPGNQGFPGTEQVSQVNTIFKNLRWYLISNFRAVLAQVYVELGLVQVIVDLPVDDAFRGGVDIHSKQLDEDQIKQLRISIERDDDLRTIGQAAKWNRLFGGAGLLILTDQDPTTPFDISSLKPGDKCSLRAADMWELFWTNQNTEGYDPSIQDQNFEHYSYYGEQVHKTRVFRMKGIEAPSFIRPRLRGWGFSVVEILVRSLNQYLKGTDLAFEVLDEFKVDVYKIKNLVNTILSPQGQQAVRHRLQIANEQKNYQNALVMDSEDDWDHKQLSFAGLAEVMAGVRKQVAADLRMPLTKLFGSSESGGIGNNDQNDMENYNAMVESQVRDKVKYDVLRVLEIKCQLLFGFVPDDLEAKFKPLRTLTAEQEENVKTQKFNRVAQARAAGEITTYEYREACNKGNLLDITLDNQGDSLNPLDPEVGELVEEGSQTGEEGMEEDTDGRGGPDAQAAKVAPDEYGGQRGESVKPIKATKGPKAKEAKESPELKNEIRPYTRAQRIDRVLVNSAEFDRASYAADGGDDWIDPRREKLFENPGNVDEALWSRAKDASMKAFGKVKWQFVTWFYKKQGGKFS